MDSRPRGFRERASPDLRRTRILVTLGPASTTRTTIRALLRSGADAFRINFSHGTVGEQRGLIRRARAAARSWGREVAVVADLQGPKLRVGAIESDAITVPNGSSLLLDQLTEPGSRERLPISLPSFSSAARPGDPILLGDGNVELRVTHVTRTYIQTRVIQGGTIHSHQGIFLPRARLRGSVLGPKDLRDLTVALDAGVDFVALSFVSSAADVRSARRAISERGGEAVGVIAKIERASALDSIDGILRASDAIMVARGDLGIEVPLERLAIEQKRLADLAHRAGRETIVATQMLLSMVASPRPTRAEATDVANAILDGADAVMLSEESAIGAFPTEAVAWMDRIARATEGAISRERFRSRPTGPRAPPTEEAVAEAAVRTAESIRAAALVVPTHSGHTARLVSRLRPEVPILALSRLATTRRRLSLTWGVRSIPVPQRLSLDQLRLEAERSARREYGVVRGTPLVMTAGYPVEGRPTNLVLVTSA